MSRIHIAFFTTGYPYVDAATRAIDLSHRHGASFSRSIGEPYGFRRDNFVRWFLDTDASHALLLEGDIVPPEDALSRLLDAAAPIATAVYTQWADDRLCTNVQMPTATTWADAVPQARVPVSRCLLGCVLISREALRKMTPPWFLSTMTASRFVTDDEWFCAMASRAGLSIICDGSVQCASFRQGHDLRALAKARAQRS
jgi:hypothetical protein